MKRTIIRYKKVVNSDGVECIEITAIENVEHYNTVPSQYILDFPYYYVYFGCAKLFLENEIYLLTPGAIYSKEVFSKIIAEMKAAGERLGKINREIKEKRKKWNGEGEITI